MSDINIKGVDLSYVQEGISGKILADNNVKFAIIRLGLSEMEDVTAAGHIKSCNENEIDYGFYWYSYGMSVEEAKKEADACLIALKKYSRPLYPVFFDMEERRQIDGLDNKTRTDMAIAFCDRIIEGGYPCGIYVNPSWLESYYEKNRLIGRYDIWLAHWTGSPDRKSRYSYGQKIWQWGLDRIGGYDIDGDACFVDYPKITKEFYDKLPEKPVAEILRKGDRVQLLNTPLYISASARNKSTTITGYYYIHSDGIINNRIRITTPKGNCEVTGWVNVDSIKKQEEQKVDIRVGDRVKVKAGALSFSGKKLATFVYTAVFDVIQSGINGYPDYIVIGIDGDVTAAMHADDLIKV